MAMDPSRPPTGFSWESAEPREGQPGDAVEAQIEEDWISDRLPRPGIDGDRDNCVELPDRWRAFGGDPRRVARVNLTRYLIGVGLGAGAYRSQDRLIRPGGFCPWRHTPDWHAWKQEQASGAQAEESSAKPATAEPEQPAAPPALPPTIRVRAAVAISGHDPANWIVAGSRLHSDDETVDLIAQSLPGLSCIRWIEADIPLPAAIKVEVL